MTAFSLYVLFEPRDLWIGVYWNRERVGRANRWSVYVCLLPMLPIRASWLMRGE